MFRNTPSAAPHAATFRLALAAVLAAAGPGVAQHEGDLAVGRTAAGQLTLKAYDPLQPCFDPAVGVGLLDYIGAANTYSTVEPGFDANFAADPDLDFYPLASGAEIWLVADADLEPAFHVEYQGDFIYLAGDDIALGSATLHRHVRFIVDGNSPDFDPLRTLWYGRFMLVDRGATGYAASAPFTLRFSIVECTPGDVNADGAVDFGDIDPLVIVLAGPAAATPEQRCAADCDRDGYVTFADIDPFVILLAGG